MKRIKFTDCVDLTGASCSEFSGEKTYVSTGAVNKNYINFADIEVVDYASKPSRANLVVKENDILFAKMQATEKTLQITAELAQNIYSTGFCAVRAKSNVISDKCLYYLLMSDAFLSQKDKNCSGATQKAITNAGLGKIEIRIPDIDCQNRLVELLDELFSLITVRKEQLIKLDELVKSRFIELFDNCKNEVLIGDVISISRGASPRPISAFITDREDGVNWIKIGDVSENSLYITKTEEKITPEGAKKSRMVYAGDFILSNSMSFGRPYILGINGCVHDGWLIMSNFKDTFNELYLYHAIRSDDVQYQFSGKVNGATVKNLNSDLVKNTYIKVPPMELQEQFASFVEHIDKSKLAIQESLDKLETLKKALMQKYFG